MSEAFLKAVNMSISAGWLVLAVLALRLILKKAPKWVNVLLWGIVAVRLICPFSIESALSLIPSAETISPNIMMDRTPTVTTGIPALNSALNPVISDSFAPAPGASANPLQIWIPVLSVIWLIGIGLMLTYTAVSYLSLRRMLETAVILRDNIFQCKTVSSPFVLGILKPRIYLPYTMDGRNLNHVIAHEQAHIRRKDHWWKPLGFLLLTVYWFNPLMWVAYILLCRDIELACDEKVIAELDNESRANYTQALVACSVNRRAIAACPLAFGEVGVKERVKSIMNYRKPGFWVIALALILCTILAVSMLTDPIPENTPADIFSTLELEDVQWAQMTVWNTPAGEHIMLDNAQIEELVAILKSLDSNDFKEKQGVHGVSVMVNCGEQEILIQTADNDVFFSFDAETAKILGDINWSIRSEDLAAWVERIAYPGAADATQWVDLVNPEVIWEIGTREITIQDFPEVTFRWTAGEITANEKALIQGMPVWNAYFVDLTGDGKPEICACVSYGSGMIDTHVVVYDYVNGQEYTLWDRGYYDYSLSLENGVLVCRKFRYPSSTPFDQTGALMVGRLMLTDAGGGEGKRLVIDTLDEKTGISDIVDRSVTEGLPTDEALEPFWEDESYIYSFPSIRSHHVMVTYYDGSAEDIRTALETGRATISDLDRFGIHYYAEPKVISMEPTQTNLRGLVAEYLFVPINGATYRYAMTGANPEDVTTDRLLDTFTEETHIESIVWEVYSLKEYPDMTKLLLRSGVGSAWLCEYAPAQQAEEGALEAARAAGLVIMEEGRLTDGQEAWAEFYGKTQRGEPASIHVAHYYTLDPERTAPGTYEAYSQDYPALYIDELEYDGEQFVLRTESEVKVYEYLMKYTGSNNAVSWLEIDEYTHYVLTHDNTVTWEQLWNGLVSSVYGAYIDHYTICSEFS